MSSTNPIIRPTQVVQYRTSDGQLWPTQGEAHEREASLQIDKSLRAFLTAAGIQVPEDGDYVAHLNTEAARNALNQLQLVLKACGKATPPVVTKPSPSTTKSVTPAKANPAAASSVVKKPLPATIAALVAAMPLSTAKRIYAQLKGKPGQKSDKFKAAKVVIDASTASTPAVAPAAKAAAAPKAKPVTAPVAAKAPAKAVKLTIEAAREMVKNYPDGKPGRRPMALPTALRMVAKADALLATGAPVTTAKPATSAVSVNANTPPPPPSAPPTAAAPPVPPLPPKE